MATVRERSVGTIGASRTGDPLELMDEGAAGVPCASWGRGDPNDGYHHGLAAPRANPWSMSVLTRWKGVGRTTDTPTPAPGTGNALVSMSEGAASVLCVLVGS